MKLNLLFVDDEKQILIPLKAMFKKQYAVFTAISGPNALEIINNNSIQIIVSDQRMPEMQGIELLKQVKEISPKTVRILLTGYADLNAVVESVNTGEIFRFIEKPWNNERLKNTIEAAANIYTKQDGIEIFDEIVTPQKSGILLVDDSLDTCAIIHSLFGDKHSVFCASNMAEALVILEQQNIAVLITETNVQGEEMTTLIHVLKETYPLTVVVILTTQADAHLVVRLINEGQIFRYLPKPVENYVLEFSINAALKRHAQFCDEPSLLASQQFIETPSEEIPEVQDKISTFKNKLTSLKQRMKKFWD
ncbi:response regulator [Candidatus Halobeggiatoa sp. HSG11]|nr:response regulator [Candidatus Halobeggiatoa sp. HSG11]